MSTRLHPEIAKWVANQQAEAAAVLGLDIDDDVLKLHPLDLRTKELGELLIISAKLSSGFFRPTKRTEVVWVDGDSELAVGINDVKVVTATGLVKVAIPVRCDQTGAKSVEVVFATGEPGRPAGVYASTYRRPIGPKVIIDVWGEALVAFAWQTVLELISQIAAAAGKDSRGNRLVPSNVIATKNGLTVEPMPRHRFFGSSGLLSAVRP